MGTTLGADSLVEEAAAPKEDSVGDAAIDGAACGSQGSRMLKVCRKVLLTQHQATELQRELREAGATARPAELSGVCKSSNDAQASMLLDPDDADDWEVYYDNVNCALTMRGWWWCRRNNAWRLLVPELVPPPDAAGSTRADAGGFGCIRYQEITDVEDILAKVGLVQHAEAWRRQNAKSKTLHRFEKLLAQASVFPFARFRGKRHVYHLSQEPRGGGGNEEHADSSSSGSGGMQLAIALEELEFDVRYAENQAVADLLFANSSTARSALKAAVAEFTLAGPSPGDALHAEALTKARVDLASSIRARELDSRLVPQQISPRLYAYLEVLRPARLRALYINNLVLLPKALEEPQEEDC
mmetsp:Transcript_33480/g.61045  ORF Transcript_33480/g.61045 Transcript_33480/m.61045 type:complete len:357 (+) Transcript_33480:65-1135(+)